MTHGASSRLETLQDCLQSLASQSMPTAWDDAVAQIEQEAAHFDKILVDGTAPIYGVNTRVGHRGHEQLSPADIQTFQQDFLASHTLGGPPWYSAYTTRCISYAKMYSLAAGGSGISTAMYHNATCSSVFNPTVKPLIPQHCTYSCGDVIPGAHWAKFVLDNFPNYEPRARAEVMALLNGSFVHVGYTLSLTRSLEKLGTLLIETTRLNNQLVQANSVNFSVPCKPHSQRIVQYIVQSLSTTHTDYRYQDPVSVRASPQIIETFVDAVRSLYQQLDYQLRSPSNNPLFSLETDYPLSQASFLAPTLSIKTEAVIEAILFALWASVNRTQHLLSGRVSTIPPGWGQPQQRPTVYSNAQTDDEHFRALSTTVRAACFRRRSSNLEWHRRLVDLWCQYY